MKICIAMIAIIFLALPVYGQNQEEIMLTTYYPAPYGEYDGLWANSLAIGEGTNLPAEGVISIKGFSTADEPEGVEGCIYYNLDDHGFRYHDGGDWVSISGIPSRGMAPFGINTDMPKAALHVQSHGLSGSAPAILTYGADYGVWSGSDNAEYKKSHSMDFGGWDGSSFDTWMNIEAPYNTGSGRAKMRVRGDLEVTGVKNFIIKHPVKPNMHLVHSCLEGPEAAVYYRGESHLENGKAIITLPDYFEALTMDNKRTILLTAKGRTPYLLSALDIIDGEFKVYGTRSDGEFYWEVKAVRNDIGRIQAEIPCQ